MKKRIAMLLAAMLLSSCAIAQAEEVHSHKICGGLTSDCGHTAHGDNSHTDSKKWTAWKNGELFPKAKSGPSYVYLAEDVELKYAWVIGNNEEVYLCLNGHNLTNEHEESTQWNGSEWDTDTAETIKVNGVLCVTDCHDENEQGSIRHAKDIKGKGIDLYGGQFYLYGGSIESHCSTYGNGAAVYMNNSDDLFAMYGGSIKGNEAVRNHGGAVYANKGEVELYGGKITDNTSEESGGGIYANDAQITIGGKGVTVSGNTAGASGSTTANNIYLSKGKTIKLAGNFDAANSGPIGVTHADAPANPEEGTQIPFLEKVGGSVTLDEVKRFVSDNPNYTTTVIDGKGYLVKGPLSFTIAYDLDGGKLPEGKGNPETYTENDAFTLHNPEKEGFTFEGWTGTGLSAATKEVTIPKGSYGDRTYKATWKAIVIPPQPISPEEALQAADLPKTGDHSGLAFWMTVLLAAGSAAFVFCRKRV